MTKVCELNSDNAYLYLPQIARKQIRLCWHDDYYHGPITGLLEYHGEKYWFHMCDENLQHANDPSWHRRYLVIELSPAQLQEEEEWHNLFREKVGTHTDYNAQGYREPGHIHSQQSQVEFYRAYNEREEPDYSDNNVIGWFQL